MSQAEKWNLACLIEIEDEDLMFDGKPLRLLHEESAGSWEGWSRYAGAGFEKEGKVVMVKEEQRGRRRSQEVRGK